MLKPRDSDGDDDSVLDSPRSQERPESDSDIMRQIAENDARVIQNLIDEVMTNDSLTWNVLMDPHATASDIPLAREEIVALVMDQAGPTGWMDRGARFRQVLRMVLRDRLYRFQAAHNTLSLTKENRRNTISIVTVPHPGANVDVG